MSDYVKLCVNDRKLCDEVEGEATLESRQPPSRPQDAHVVLRGVLDVGDALAPRQHCRRTRRISPLASRFPYAGAAFLFAWLMAGSLVEINYLSVASAWLLLSIPFVILARV